ncbi:hypothetical protein ACFE04_028016 [Oxalis oulophora]
MVPSLRRRAKFVQDYTQNKTPNFQKSSFTKRISTLKWKAEQLSIFCDVPICLVCFESNGTCHSWPQDETSVRDIVNNLRPKLKYLNPKKQLDLLGVLKAKKKSFLGKKALGFKEFETLTKGWSEKEETLSVAELASYDSYLDHKLEGLKREIESRTKQQEDKQKEDGFWLNDPEINNVELLPKVEVHPYPKAINSYNGECSRSNHKNQQSNYAVESRGLATCSTGGVFAVTNPETRNFYFLGKDNNYSSLVENSLSNRNHSSYFPLEIPSPEQTWVFGNSNSNNPNDNNPANIIPNYNIMQINETIPNPVLGTPLTFSSGFPTEFSQIGRMGNNDTLGYPNYNNNDTPIRSRNPNFDSGIPENFELTNLSSRLPQSNMGYRGVHNYGMRGFQNGNNQMRSDNGNIIVNNSQELNWLNLLSQNQQRNHMGEENPGWMVSNENAMMMAQNQNNSNVLSDVYNSPLQDLLRTWTYLGNNN